MVRIFLRWKTQTWKVVFGCLPGKRMVCSASKVTTCSSVYQTCHVVVNSMLRQQGDNSYQMSIMSCYCQTRWQSLYIVFSGRIKKRGRISWWGETVVCSASKATTSKSYINHVMLLSNKSTVTWLTLLRFYLRIWLSPAWILPSAAKASPASVTKKLPLIPFLNFHLSDWSQFSTSILAHMYIYDRWDDSHFLIYHPCRHDDEYNDNEATTKWWRQLGE